MQNDDSLDVDEFFNMMGNDVRRKIMNFLTRGPMSIADLSKEIEVSKQAILKHLKELEQRGIVETKQADEKAKKAGPNPNLYELKDFFSIHVDMNPASFNPRVIRFHVEPINTGSSLDKMPEEKKDVPHFSECIKALSDVNDRIDAASKIYNELMKEKSKTLQKVRQIVTDNFPHYEERSLLAFLYNHPKLAQDGFTVHDIIPSTGMRDIFVRSILDHLVSGRWLQKNGDDRYRVR
nr:MarR family transcriptional regulator [Candidatus Sigynarchaeota archaeon]